MARFFVDKNNIHGSKITVVGEDVIHISKVLRMRPGEELTLCNGEGIDFLCKIEDISKKEIICSVISEKENESESRIPITIYQSMPKGAKIDYVIQKCVELGAARIVTFQSARSVAKGSKTDRLSRIALEAAKQCGRGIVPQVSYCSDFKDALSEFAGHDLSVFAYEEEHVQSLKDVLRNASPKNIGIMIGPEGGFEPDEAVAAKSSGAQSVSLGKRILRTETTAMVVLSDVIYEYNL